MATHLLVLYVTVEQESAIRDLYKQKRWTLMQTDPSVEIKLEKEEIAEPPHKEKNDVKEKPCEENVPMKEQLPVKNTSDTVLASKKKMHNKTHLCDECGQSFTAESSLVSHHARKHGNPSSLPCLHCAKTFSTKADRDRHARTHGIGKLYVCELCGAEMTTSCALTDHLTRHRGDGRFVCEHCGKRFVQLYHYRGHLATHYSSKQGSCPCGAIYNYVSNLKRHQKKCTGIPKHILKEQKTTSVYNCPMCGKVFQKKKYVDQHLETHNSKTPCERCGKLFQSKQSLKKHLQKCQLGV